MTVSKWHELTAEIVEGARAEVVMKDHQLASAPARNGSVKRLFYNPGTDIYRITTASTEATCKTSAEAARLYSDK